MVLADVSKESDPALINQVAYAIAMTNLNRFLIKELVSTRRNLSRARLYQYLGESTPTLSRRQARRSGLPDPGPSRRVPEQVSVLEGVPVSADLTKKETWTPLSGSAALHHLGRAIRRTKTMFSLA